MVLLKVKNKPERRIVLQHLQSILVVISFLLITLVVLLELFSSKAGILCFIAYLFGALAYIAEIFIIVLRAKEHQVHRTELVMPVIFGFLYLMLALKYLRGEILVVA